MSSGLISNMANILDDSTGATASLVRSIMPNQSDFLNLYCVETALPFS
jgi:hypothetical protein